MLTENDVAPEFTLQNQDGEEVSLRDFRGRSVVLYFYPRDDTSGCTTQACELRDRVQTFDAKDAVILGVSPDDVASHRSFADKFSLPFTLLADTQHEVAEKYGVWQEKSMYGRKYWGNERTTFVIDGDGRIAKVLPKVKPAEHVDQVLASL
ncbi:thioredoxin-dependent thiol peroxidase [soil metagenome]